MGVGQKSVVASKELNSAAQGCDQEHMLEGRCVHSR